MYDDFIRAINEKKVVEVMVDTEEKGLIKRKCVPFDFGPSRRGNDRREKFHFYDLDSPDGAHNLSITPEKLRDLKVTPETFEPCDYVKWEPNWFVQRDWGEFS